MNKKLQDNQPLLVENQDEYWYDLSISLDRLKDNSDFKKVFLDGYLKDYALSRMSLLNSNLNVERTRIIEILVGISNFESFCQMIYNFADNYKQKLQEKNNESNNEDKVDERY